MSTAPTNLLRLATAGSVDDGKSTLIGRLLYDSKTVFSDQLEAIEQTSRRRGEDRADLALLTDGLRAEREQGITIDVAYRYFATPRRKFIVADTPGHVQYTRNMVTGASTADLALILINANNGVLEQTRRHAFLASLLGVPHLVVCVNKMDLVDYSAERFAEICDEFRQFAAKLDVHDLSFIPISALHGDNIVHHSANMPWHDGPPLLHHLEEVHIASDRNLIDARFPVQYVVRKRGFRGYAGTIASGVLRPGDDVQVLPAGLTTTVTEIWQPDGTRSEHAFPPQAIVMTLADDIDVGRGDLICRPGNRPHTAQDVDALVCWFADHVQLSPSNTYVVQHTTRATRAHVVDLAYRLDINTLHRDESASGLSLNEIGRIRLHTQQPLLFDPYRQNRHTGSFILIDEHTNDTVAAGMITQPSSARENIIWHQTRVNRNDRGTQGATVWLTGLSGSGKSSIASELERILIDADQPAYVLDGDNLRHGLNADLGFSPGDRAENVRRVAEVARLFADAGLVAIVSLISPYQADRDAARAIHEESDLPFLEVFVNTPIDICVDRDPKGLYRQARAGDLSDLTGIDAPYEAPTAPDLTLEHGTGSPATMASRIWDMYLHRAGLGQ